MRWIVVMVGVGIAGCDRPPDGAEGHWFGVCVDEVEVTYGPTTGPVTVEFVIELDLIDEDGELSGEVWFTRGGSTGQDRLDVVGVREGDDVEIDAVGQTTTSYDTITAFSMELTLGEDALTGDLVLPGYGTPIRVPCDLDRQVTDTR